MIPPRIKLKLMMTALPAALVAGGAAATVAGDNPPVSTSRPAPVAASQATSHPATPTAPMQPPLQEWRGQPFNINGQRM